MDSECYFAKMSIICGEAVGKGKVSQIICTTRVDSVWNPNCIEHFKNANNLIEKKNKKFIPLVQNDKCHSVEPVFLAFPIYISNLFKLGLGKRQYLFVGSLLIAY